MPELFLIRHGDNDFLVHNRLPGHLPDIHLNRRGLDQAAELDRSLSHLPFKAIYASPLERAQETATPLAHTLNLEIQTHPGLIDIDVGAWAARSWKVLGRTKLWKIIQKEPSSFQFPGGESIVNVQTRVISALEEIIAAHTEELVAVVFHSDPIKLAVCHYLGIPLDGFQRLTISTGSVTILRVEGDLVRLHALNLIPPIFFPKH
jgi:broad specificity phosphatase PhoE